VQSFPQHERANGTVRVGLPWPSLLAFLRLVTNPRVFERPASIRTAWQQIEEWLGCETTWVPAPTERHREVLGRLLDEANVRANLIPDAHLAALAIEHGLVLASTDGDFARFPGLRLENPLAGPEET
jgi:toxin-antitoxin system PIN domain toxin